MAGTLFRRVRVNAWLMRKRRRSFHHHSIRRTRRNAVTAVAVLKSREALFAWPLGKRVPARKAASSL